MEILTLRAKAKEATTSIHRPTKHSSDILLKETEVNHQRDECKAKVDEEMQPIEKLREDFRLRQVRMEKKRKKES